MSIVRWTPRSEWDPFAGLMDLQREMSQIFGSPHGQIPIVGLGNADGGWLPAMDVFEIDDNVHVKMDLPGLSRDDVQITVRDNLLTIQGEKKHRNDVKEEQYYRMERVFGSFTRTIQLPAFIDRDKVAAKFKDGVLDIVLPKVPEAKQKPIPVQED